MNGISVPNYPIICNTNMVSTRRPYMARKATGETTRSNPLGASTPNNPSQTPQPDGDQSSGYPQTEVEFVADGICMSQTLNADIFTAINIVAVFRAEFTTFELRSLVAVEAKGYGWGG